MYKHNSFWIRIITFLFAVATSVGQRDATLPISPNSFRQILRTKENVPTGRTTNFNNILLHLYSNNSTNPTTRATYRIGDMRSLLADTNFDTNKPTVLYSHGYVELSSDESVSVVVGAYLRRGRHNILVLDWSNLAFGNYVNVALDVKWVGIETGKALLKLLRGGLSLPGLHLVGHSLGAHLVSASARYLASQEYIVPRLTGLDPAYPGFYPPLLGPALSGSDAEFVDVIHTDGGGYGAPTATGLADFWPNEGQAKQPGCLSATLPFTVEDFCSHWRSWQYWAESVTGGEFRARLCDNYDDFLRGLCRDNDLVYMGLKADPGNNSTNPATYRIGDMRSLLADTNFDTNKPTVLYSHGYVELSSDESVSVVVGAYLRRGRHNILVLDWSNLAFGNYVNVALDVKWVGIETGKALLKLLRGGLSLPGLHLVGHSLGAHLVSASARYLASQEYIVPRLTGLDPAYPGFYPPLLGPALSGSDAEFVDVIHTDGGGYGAPTATGLADFWPNEGQAKQPGCLSATLPFTVEDFCSHWRSWQYWAESVTGGEFRARLCDNYDDFLRGLCRDNDLVYMGLKADPSLRGNFYLRTAAKKPFALGLRGAQ